MASKLILVLGGVRSGKSTFAEKLVRELGCPTLYLATGQATDDEMARRIQLHRHRRPSSWTTLEEPLELAQALESAMTASNNVCAVMIDSLDTWVSNLLLAQESQPVDQLVRLAESEVERLSRVCENWSATVVMVSSEVGHSLVPPNELGRRFQDLLGLVNQQIAAAAHEVYVVVAGIPVMIKCPPEI